MGKSRAVIVFAAAIAIAAAPITSCLDATEIVIGLSANVDCATVTKNGALIRIGSPTNVDTSPSTAISATACATDDATTMNDLGNVVIVPSGSVDALVAVDVVLSLDPAKSTASCIPEVQGNDWCIYTRRQISFLPHTHVYLPIELDAACAGNLCVEGQSTCQNGVCVPIDVDPHDCGTQCTTGPDAVPPIDSGPLIDVHVDVPVIDAPADISLDTSGCNGTLCGNVCVDLNSDKQNCGKCGFDCSNGNCINGTCQLNATAVASCLVLYNNEVWIQGAYVGWIKTNGGLGAIISQNATYAIASVPSTNLAWFEKTTTQTDIDDYATTTLFTEVGSAAFLAISPKVGYAWSDPSVGYVMYQPLTGPSASVLSVPKQSVPIAFADKNVYASVGAQILWGVIGGNGGSLQTSLSSSIVVDDPTSAKPNVYFVDKGTIVLSTDYQLSTPQKLATSTKAITAIAWDASMSTIVANMGSEIDIVQNGTFVTAAKAVNAAPKCVAVDADAVYWLEQAGGIYKHFKP